MSGTSRAKTAAIVHRPTSNVQDGELPGGVLLSSAKLLTAATPSPSARNKLRVIDLETRTIAAALPLGLQPDTLQLSPSEKVLTVGLREQPAPVAVVDTETLTSRIVTIAGSGTTAGHQWTSTSGRYTSPPSMAQAPAWR